MIDILLFLVPAYVANSSPVLIKGKTPLDLGNKFLDNKRILGNSKTLEGFIGGIAAGTLIGLVITALYRIEFYPTVEAQIMGALTLSLGTLVGDSIGSFIKRRFGRKEGSPFFLDSIMFIVVALLLTYPFAQSGYTLENLSFIIILTIIIHPLANILANKLGWKKVPW